MAIMSPEQHQARHMELHQSLDELLACFCTENRKAGSLRNPIVDLLHWAYVKTLQPSEAVSHTPAIDWTVQDFEGQRQMIVLALAELALSRPGFDAAIREIARNFDDVGLPTFEHFKTSNADRVGLSHAPLGPMIAQQDEPRIFEWLSKASTQGGGFVSTIASAALRADFDNYPVVRPVILEMLNRYPEFGI